MGDANTIDVEVAVVSTADPPPIRNDESFNGSLRIAPAPPAAASPCPASP